MTDKEFRRLSKSDLLDIIFELQKNEEKLREQIADLNGRLNSKELKIKNAGSIAEAAIAVNNVVESAQAAADQYLSQLRIFGEKVKFEAIKKAEKIVMDAKITADKILKNAESQSVISEKLIKSESTFDSTEQK